MSKSHKLWVFVISSFLFPIHLGHGSTAVIIARQDSVTAAADSRVSNIGGKRLPDGCKVAVSDSGMIFVNSGKLNDFTGAFIDTGRKIISGNRNVVSAAEALDKALVPRLKRLAKEIMVQEPIYYKKRVENQSLYSAGFAILTSRGPQVASRDYVVLFGPSIRIDPTQCLDRCDGGMLASGENEEITQFYARDSSYTLTHDPIMTVRMFIGLEISAHPKTVGPPIAIVQVRSSGVRWVDHGACK